MTLARAPGKLVLSGAYAVLEGAPALVCAVDRFVVADSSKPASLVTDEVRAALSAGLVASAVAFDASALRSDDGARKLGLGSSAAILIATLLAAPGPRAKPALSREWIEDAVRAHREAQGGGSGIDVVASAAGGVLCAELVGGELRWAAHTLPRGATLSVWSMGAEASTRSMLASVRALAESRPAEHGRLLGALAEASRAAVAARDTGALRAALVSQGRTLAALGDAAGAPIVPEAIRALARDMEPTTAVLPSGAGGGDVVLAISDAPLGTEQESAFRAAGLERVSCAIAPADYPRGDGQAGGAPPGA